MFSIRITKKKKKKLKEHTEYGNSEINVLMSGTMTNLRGLSKLQL